MIDLFMIVLLFFQIHLSFIFLFFCFYFSFILVSIYLSSFFLSQETHAESLHGTGFTVSVFHVSFWNGIYKCAYICIYLYHDVYNIAAEDPAWLPKKVR